MDEPTLYDYLKSLFDSETHVDLPISKSTTRKQITERRVTPQDEFQKRTNWYKLTLGCLFSISAQYFLKPDVNNVLLAVFLYLIAFYLIWSADGHLQKDTQEERKSEFKIKIKYIFFAASIVSQILAFAFYGNNRFNLLNTSLWLAGIVFLFLAFWVPKKRTRTDQNNTDKIFLIILGVIILIVFFFRVFQMHSVPGEMYSDHAEKLLDVMDILKGEFPVFFERNTGREPLQFYITALITKAFNTGYSFLSLKIGTITFGLLTLPFIYLLAKDFGNKWVGLAALFLAGVAYWPNVISRVGLRYSLYPLFTAPVVYFLFRGIRENNLNSLLFCGLFAGLGLHGYSSFRVIPVFIILVILLHVFSKYSTKKKDSLIKALIIIGAISLAVFLPLFRYWFDHPGSLSYRSLTRLTQIEKPFDEPGIWIFLKNAIASLLMPFSNNGHIWVHSIPNRPALDFISGGFYFIGLVSLIQKYLHERGPELLSLLISIPILMLPSILSLAYPGENPSLNRSAGAYVSIFIIAGHGLYAFTNAVKNIFNKKVGSIIYIGLAFVFSTFIVINNYNLVFVEYKEQFNKNAWNSSEIGKVVREFLESDTGDKTAYVVPYPHWVDTRLVGFTAGYPGRDFALWQEDIPNLKDDSSNKMFIYKPEDGETKIMLSEIYPNGETSVFYSQTMGKEFIIYTVMDINK